MSHKIRSSKTPIEATKSLMSSSNVTSTSNTCKRQKLPVMEELPPCRLVIDPKARSFAIHNRACQKKILRTGFLPMISSCYMTSVDIIFFPNKLDVVDLPHFKNHIWYFIDILRSFSACVCVFAKNMNFYKYH